MNTAAPALTVVVMGYRNEATIEAAVASVLEQRAPEPVEVVVVTSGGDRSADVVRRAHPTVEVVESGAHLLPGGARNAGVEAARGGVVAFLAADCLAEPGWAAARLVAHRAGHPVVAGAMTPAPPHRPSSWASHLTLYRHRLAGRPPGLVAHPDPAAHGLSYDRAVLDRLGPFDAAVRVGEDTEAARRLGALGVTIWFEPSVRTAHCGPHSTLALLADHHRRGRLSARAAGPALRPIGWPRAVVALPLVTALCARATVAEVWRNGRGERHRLVLSLPWVVAAVAAGLSGHYRERLRRAR